MTPFKIRWSFDDALLRQQRPNLDLARMRRLYFEDAARVWSYVLMGWPTQADGSALRLPDGSPFVELAIDVEFVPLVRGSPADKARVDAAEIVAHCIAGPDGSRLPTRGTIQIDLLDIDALLKDRASFKDTVVHEIGHVLGLGTLFATAGLVRTDAEKLDWYIGTHGCRGYADLLGVHQAVEIPLQAEVGSTTRAHHFDEQALPGEIMSTALDQPRAGGGSGGATAAPGLINVVSPVSAGALKDLGCVVDLSRALRTPAYAQRKGCTASA